MDNPATALIGISSKPKTGGNNNNNGEITTAPPNPTNPDRKPPKTLIKNKSK